tara:strand:- start:26998 stop:28101 length:1104 start_codon:yes stop_codon:yes gene_type:complete
MPFQRPTLDQLIERVEGDIKGGLGITTVLRRSFVAVIARALAGLSHLLFGFLGYTAEQVFPDTAEQENLERWSRFWGVFRNEATFAEINVTITGNEGGSLPAGTVFQREDGEQYTLETEQLIPVSGSVIAKVIAVTAGSSQNLSSGDTISLLSPIVDVDSDATFESVVTEGENRESDESLRSRLVARVQQAPLGGSANDYIQTMLGVAGVTRAWVLPLNSGPGTVDCTFVEDGEDPISPSPAKVSEVDDALQAFKPVTALVTTFAPTLAPATFDISIKPNTLSVQDAITKELEDLMVREGQIAGAYKDGEETHDGVIKLSKIRTAIGISVGLEDYEINTINAVAPDDITPNAGELITLGAINWQPLA